MLPNVVLCGRQALALDLARCWRPVRTSYGLGRSLKNGRACRSDLLDMAMIRSTTTAHDV